MRIVFLHYHLKTGGVTSVLKQQVLSIRNECETLVLAGEPPDGPFPAKVVHIPQLAYSDRIDLHVDPKETAARITRSIEAHFNGRCDVLHIHNPTLAKNDEFLNILGCLQERGLRLFLQIHDLAEDGRPGVYFSEDYPADCHYGVINSRDYRLLLNAGLKPEGLHLLPNAVPAPPVDVTAPMAKTANPYVLYPIRAIRRKNIGEAILVSLFFKQSETLAITLPPNSPADIKSYNDWKQFVKRLDLKVMFELGLEHDFDALIQSAKYMITTSISEGFGFSFLEPWLHDRFLWGRKLADICRDFETNGLNLDHMYTGLVVPVDWVESRQFQKQWQRCVAETCRQFDFEIETHRLSEAFEVMTGSGSIDFSILNEHYQKKIIARLTENPSHLNDLEKCNPQLAVLGDEYNDSDIIQNNKRVVRQHYDLAQYRRKLLNIYHKVIEKTVNQQIDKKILLTDLLDLSRFSLLKWCDYTDG